LSARHRQLFRRRTFNARGAYCFHLMDFPPRRAKLTEYKEAVMLYWALVFLVIALIAGLLGFAGIATAAAGIAKILFYVFLIVFLVTLVMGLGRRGSKV
jgi:uncharacterized membrane protein YtjA (UPF0391 family)